MRLAVVLLLALCCLLVAADNDLLPTEKSVPPEMKLYGDASALISPLESGRKLLQSTCGVSVSCIFVQNNCSKDLKVVIYYLKLDGTWVTDGIWRVKPGERVRTVQTKNRILYFHAQSDDGSILFGKDGFRDFEGKRLPFSRVNTGKDFVIFTQRFNC